MHDKEGTLIARMPVGATFFDQTYYPYLEDYPEDYSDLDHQMGKILWSALVHSPWDHAGEKDFYKVASILMFELENEFDLIDLDDKQNRFSQMLLRVGGLLKVG